MTVPIRIPLSSPDIGEAEIAAVTAVLRSSQLSLGPELPAFERAFEALHPGTSAVAVSSGTSGLHLSLLALGIGPGDEVILPSFTFVAVANAILQVGATPVFAEIDPLTLSLDPEDAAARITSRTRAIVVVHTFGIPAPIDQFIALARHHNLLLIEDACEALGARLHDQPVGTFGDAAVFGFYPNKQITTGEGGMILVRNPKYAARLRSLRNQGRTPHSGWLDHAEPGYNYRLSELACSLGRVQLQRLPEILALRAQTAAHYQQLLAPLAAIDPPPQAIPNATISWFVYVIRLAPKIDRDRIQQALATQGIATSRYFPPIHCQPAWLAHSASNDISLPITESIAKRTLALPFFNRITPAQQEEVVSTLNRAIAE